MSPRIQTVLGVVVAIVAFAAGWGTALLLHPAGSTSHAPSRSGTLSIIAAGTLGTFFGQASSALVNETPGIAAPAAAQTYEGSLLALAAVNTSGANPDVTAAADYRLIPRLLEPTAATWEILFATTPEVLAYDPSVAAFDGVNSSNWAQKLQSPGVRLGVANQSTDPNGYNGIFVLQLEGLRTNGSLSSVYRHFYTTGVGTYASPDPTTTQIEPEAQASTILSAHTVSAFIIYRSYAVQHHLTYVDLDPSVGLGDVSGPAIQHDALASTSLRTASGGLLKVNGAPVAFAASVPTFASNSTLGIAFLHYLLSPEGTALATADGFDAVFPGWADHLSAVPAILRPDVVGLPTDLPTP